MKKSEKYRAIPEGYMTVGELAKKMGTTVRTLQYYDREGLLPSSSESDGGRRLYTDKDMIKLHQILSLKYLGFSLGDIKTRLVSLDTPEDVATALAEHSEAIRNRIAELSETLRAAELLREEVLLMQSVDFRKYADIIVNLQMKNDFYGLVKYLDNKTLDKLRSNFDNDGAALFVKSISHLTNKAIQFQKGGILPESLEGQEFAKIYWAKMLEATGGDMNMIVELAKAVNDGNGDDRWRKKQDIANSFIEPALEAYLAKSGYNPFEGMDVIEKIETMLEERK